MESLTDREKEVIAAVAHRLSNKEIAELTTSTARYISEFINTIPGEILADSEESYDICHKVVHKQMDGIQQFGYH